MLEFLRGWIVNIVTISLILILFEIIVPSGKIKKIITLISGFVLLTAVVTPFVGLKNGNFDLTGAINADSLFIDRKEVENSSKFLKEAQAKQISELYKRKLVARIEDEAGKLREVAGTKASVEINEDYSSDRFGEIIKISIEIKKAKKNNDSKRIEPVASVERIDINTPAEKKNKAWAEFITPEDKTLAEQVKQSLNKSLEIKKDSIDVVVTSD